MMKFSPMAALACLLCVGIMYLGLGSPQQSRLNADDIAKKKAEIDRADALAKQLMDTLKAQSAINEALTNADTQTIDTLSNLQESIRRLGEHVRESVPTREEVTRLVSTKADDVKSEVKAESDCTSGEKLAELQQQIDELKAKVATLECNPAITSKPSSGFSTSSYATTSTPVVVSSGGSTGSVVSYGSTGSVVRSSSGGSTGSISSAVQYSPGPTSPGHWTYPGTINSHLQSDHGVSTAGMTRSQMLNLHDSLHEGTATASVVTRSAPVPVVSSVSDCPGGNCPTACSVNRTVFPLLRSRFNR